MSARSNESHVLRFVQRKTYKTIPLYSVEDDPRLSWKAVGILVYMITRPEGWVFYRNDLVSRHKDGMDGVKSGLRELRELGYLRLKPKSAGGWTWYLSERPMSNDEWSKVLDPSEGKPAGERDSRITNNSTLEQEVQKRTSSEGGDLFGEEPTATAPKTKRKHNTQRDYTPAFESLWAIHARGSKWKAFDEYNEILATGAATVAEMEAGLRSYVEGFAPDFVGAHLENWLRGGRWAERPRAARTEGGYDYMGDLERIGAGR